MPPLIERGAPHNGSTYDEGKLSIFSPEEREFLKTLLEENKTVLSSLRRN
jgi:hypothetical protein